MEENFNVHLGKKLRMRRLSLGLTQTKVAQAINVTFQQIQKYEKGTNGVSSNRLMQLSQFLKVPIIYFFEDFKEFKDVNSSDNMDEDLNYSFLKGKRIGIIGETGVGKSTFVDIVMGLLEPTKGSIYIDKANLNHTNLRSWQKQIAHVPQNIFLTDGTIYQNIAFGVQADEIDDERLKNATKDAQLDKFVRKLPYGYNTNIGETGIKLSGGQKQRIGIARALYKKAKIIIFDEATNSLDGETEKLIMDTIYRLNKDLTLIIIAHRLSTLSQCDEIIEIKNNKIIKTYEK